MFLAQKTLAMNAKERSELLRRRFKAVGGLPWTAPTTAEKRVDRSLTEKRPPNHRDFTCGFQDADRRPLWFTRPEAVPETPVISIKRRSGVSALTKIAAKAPKKLKRNFRDADHLLNGCAFSLAAVTLHYGRLVCLTLAPTLNAAMK